MDTSPSARNEELMEWMAQNASWWAGGESPDAVRENVAWMIADPAHWKWEIWKAGTFAGVILLSRITPRVDALFHFTLFPASQTGVTLFAARRLLWNFLGYAFEQFQLQRISAEVPEHHVKFAQFMRQRLGFLYEGERNAIRFQTNKNLVQPDPRSLVSLSAQIASHGARREKAHWNGEKWADLMLLRVLREEYEARDLLGAQPQATREIPQQDSHVPRIETRTIPATDAQRDAARLPGAAVPTPPESLRTT